jgi:hypothetical protein
LDERLAEPIGVVAFVGEQLLGRWQGRQHERRALEVAYPAFAEQHDERPASAVADRVQLGVQAAFAPDTSGNRPFFKRLAAVRCAFKCVASIMIRSGFQDRRLPGDRDLGRLGADSGEPDLRHERLRG